MRTPSLRRHKPSGQVVVTLDGRDHYLGAWPAKQPAPAVRAETPAGGFEVYIGPRQRGALERAGDALTSIHCCGCSSRPTS